VWRDVKKKNSVNVAFLRYAFFRLIVKYLMNFAWRYQEGSYMLFPSGKKIIRKLLT